MYGWIGLDGVWVGWWSIEDLYVINNKNLHKIWDNKWLDIIFWKFHRVLSKYVLITKTPSQTDEAPWCTDGLGWIGRVEWRIEDLYGDMNLHKITTMILYFESFTGCSQSIDYNHKNFHQTTTTIPKSGRILYFESFTGCSQSITSFYPVAAIEPHPTNFPAVSNPQSTICFLVFCIFWNLVLGIFVVSSSMPKPQPHVQKAKNLSNFQPRKIGRKSA